MKVAISAAGQHLESSMDERFGRCRYFIIVETDDMSFEVIENTNADLSTSAGIQSASLVASKGVEAVITGNCGPKAMQVFAATNIKMIIGQRGVIKDVVEKFKSGELTPSTRGNVPGKSGVVQTASVPDAGQPGWTPVVVAAWAAAVAGAWAVAVAGAWAVAGVWAADARALTMQARRGFKK